MIKKRITSFILGVSLFAGCMSADFGFAAAQENKRQRAVYIHALGENPQETADVSVVYADENTDIYFAVDNPNMGDYIDGEHTEPQYDLNGYTVSIYFDPTYFDWATSSSEPIDYTIPDLNIAIGETGNENTDSGTVEDVPKTEGYYAYRHGSGSKVINGKTYKSAYLTVFFSGRFIPQKQKDILWYNLCKLTLKPLRTGSTQVFFDTFGENDSVELFAKNTSEELEEQTFSYTAINGGYHTIVIKDKNRPAAPTATPAAGSYNEKQYVTLTAEKDCDIYYSLHGEESHIFNGTPIEIENSSVITCYAQRKSDGKQSSTVKFDYKILPKSPFVFIDNDGKKEAVPNVYSENDIFTVYVSDKSSFGKIDDGSEIYYTFSNATEDEVGEGTDPETEWVKLDPRYQSIGIYKKTTVRLITKKLAEFSDVSEYHFSVKPAAPISNMDSGEYDKIIDIQLSTQTANAEIYYTLNGSDPLTNGILYDGAITLASDVTLRAVTFYDDTYSEISSYYYIFPSADDFGITAFYPSGVYEGEVYVTLIANTPENKIEYSVDGGNTWDIFEKTLTIDSDTEILAKAIDDNDESGDIYTFTYKIKSLPPKFAPESTQFTNSSTISVYCVESTKENSERFDLFYTLDDTDPITSETRILATGKLDSAEIEITKYTVVKAVVLKDKSSYSTVVTNSYDIVTKKPTKPIVTLIPGNYTQKIGDEDGFATQFLPVVDGTEIYYTISRNGAFVVDPIPNVEGTIKYDGSPIEITGNTIIKAVALNIFGIKSDVGIFQYVITPEAPQAAPSATVSGEKLPLIPVSAVKGSTVKYEINDFKNEFFCESGSFYIDLQTGNAYFDKECTDILGTRNDSDFSTQAKLTIKSELDGIESLPNYYVYSLSNNSDKLAKPYADIATGEYEEIKIDDDNNILHIHLYSLNVGDSIQYKLNNSSTWNDYDDNEGIKIKQDSILQLRSEKSGIYSPVESYIYTFVPLAPIITLESGPYLLSSNPQAEIEYDFRAPTDKIENCYQIWYRQNGDQKDVRYNGAKRDITHTMSFKAYVINNDTGRMSKNTIHYYIIESESSAYGSVYIATPYDVSRISAAVLDTGEYAKGIKLLTQNSNAKIRYFYSYTLKNESGSIASDTLTYDNTPITVNPSMTSIVISAWLEDENGRIENSDFTHEIEFVHLNIPITSLGNEKIEFSKNTTYTIINDYPNDPKIFIYYTLDESSPTESGNKKRKKYDGEKLTLTGATTIKTVYFSACGSCVNCKNDNFEACINGVYGKTGEYKYTTPTIIGGGGGGGGSHTTIDKTRKYTKDIFGNEHPTHIGYIKGYPDGSVRPDGKITREEVTTILYRITNHEYEKPFIESGDIFPDVELGRWSAHDIEYMADKNIIEGYPDGEFKPSNNLTRAEFAALICRFTKLNDPLTDNPFNDLDSSHWAYQYILCLGKSGLINGYEDGSFRGENEITRAEVMTVVNKLLGRTPFDVYVKSLDFNPFTDLYKDFWYYTDVLEATVTHNYYLNNLGIEYLWEDWK